jgi:cyclopropane fatty-acyl-phospholipid synthase-like methyltransferase
VKPSGPRDLIEEVAAYYSSKLAQYGQTPRGVDWNGEEGQMLRFEQLCKLIEVRDRFSLNDLGCGYGAFYDFLASRYGRIAYVGIDISEPMIRAAEERCRTKPEVRFVLANAPDQVADYSVASGIFNVRLGRADDEWRAYVQGTLDVLHEKSNLGFAFNCLTSYSDADRKRDNLFYAEPGAMFDLCKRRYSRNVALLHDYDLYEFTLVVRKKA